MSRPPVATVTLDAFWGALFPDGDGFIELRALPSKDRDFFPSDDLAGIESFLGTHLAENLYFGVAARVAPGDGSLAGCGRLVVLFADIDFKTTPESGATARLERFPLQPSIVVKSGGGWHLYWLLREPADLRVNGEAARIKGLLRRLAIALGGDLAAAEPARVLRVPGTLNQKYTPPREVLVERFDAIFGFNLSDFDDLLPSEPPGDGDGASPFRMPQELPDGTRNPNLYRLGRSLRARGLSAEAIAAALRVENATKGRPPKSDAELAEIIEHALSQPDRPGFQPRATEQPGAAPYLIENGRICRQKFTMEGPVADPLCNFTAAVSEELIQDDGVETTRVFKIVGSLETGQPLPPIRVSASRFAGMAWVADSWGLKAVVKAGSTVRDHLREAIQRLSPDAAQRVVFTHTGWRQIGGEWVYLTAGGAVDKHGYEVDLGALSRYRLPSSVEDPVEAMRASLRLWQIAPYTITVPLWASVYRAVLGGALPVDLSLWVEAATGRLKSTTVSLFLSHWGDFSRLTLPAEWKSTANALEKTAFVLKDAVLVIDDYAPSALDSRELESKAARVLRGQGNLSGRGRLRADLSERPSYPPRGLIISTGEQHPPGQSLLARTLLIGLDGIGVNIVELTACQQSAHRLPHALAGFIRWLAPQMPTLAGTLRRTWQDTRNRAASGRGHLRVPEVLAHLWLGIDCPLAYAEESGACSAEEATRLRAIAWDALLEAGRAQRHLVEGERPTRRFLQVLATLLTQGRGLLLPKAAQDPGKTRSDLPLVGWEDEGVLFLLPDAAFNAVAKFCRDSGEPFPIRQVRLGEDMRTEGLTECDVDRTTSTVRIAGLTRRVWRLKRDLVDAVLGVEFSSFVTGITEITGSER